MRPGQGEVTEAGEHANQFVALNVALAKSRLEYNQRELA
jgi:hypothetical protein